MIEEWRPVTDWEGHEISDHGRIQSLDRIITFPDGRSRWAKGQMLKPQKRSGYYVIQIDRKTRYIHDLVLEAFVGPKPEGQCVRHGPLGQLANVIWNVCYGTRSENEYDKVRDGTHQQTRKTHCPRNHEYSAENTAWWRRGRHCKQCERDRNRRRRTPA